MGRLTTHVLDTANGCPAEGMAYTLRRLDTPEAVLARGFTNKDGRCDDPLLEGPAFTAGRYELEFAAGTYFAGKGMSLPRPPFVGDVVLRFGIADPGQHYHVPLLVSPWSYSTYRGS